MHDLVKQQITPRLHRLAVLAGLAVGAVAMNARALDYDLARDFSPSANPGGPWSYAAETTLNAPVTLFGVSGLVFGDGGAPIQYWQLGPGVEPTIYRNPGPGPLTIGPEITLPANMVMLFSGADHVAEGFGVARFTVPAAPTQAYRIRATAQPVYDSPTQGDTDFHVVHNGVEVFGRFLAGAETASYSNQVTLVAGDRIDFVVGRGAENTAFASGLKVFANIEVVSANPPPPPPPPAISYNLARDFSPSVNPAGAWSYGAKPALTGVFSPFGVRGVVFGDGGAPIQYWQLVPLQEPTIYRNPGPGTIAIAGGAVTLPPSMVMLFSGTDGAANGLGVARFTVPAGGAGRYRIHSEARPIYDTALQGDTDFYVLKNDKRLFKRKLSGTKKTHFSRRLTLEPGDTVEFIVGRGRDGSGFASGLKVFAALELIRHDDNPDEDSHDD